MDKEFDLFTMPRGTPNEEQRDFEIWWHKTTGRRAIVVEAGIEYKKTLEYPE